MNSLEKWHVSIRATLGRYESKLNLLISFWYRSSIPQLTNKQTNYMEKSPASQERFITVFTGARHWSISSARWIHISVSL
jgi:hypothetical protein